MIIYVGVFMPGSDFSLLAQCLRNLSAIGVTHDYTPTYVRTYGSAKSPILYAGLLLIINNYDKFYEFLRRQILFDPSIYLLLRQ
jgi:hypothetical protein